MFHDVTAVHQEWRLRGFAIEVEVINFAQMYSIGHSMTAFGTSGNIDVDVLFPLIIIHNYQYNFRYRRLLPVILFDDQL